MTVIRIIISDSSFLVVKCNKAIIKVFFRFSIYRSGATIFYFTI